ncbi:MAG: molybdopterin-dependent oxidoreductase, partial [Dehalococcoidia bacterium]|nr:molybdopterin-dependent oxidoreductase [Dehalococcoidia bacterium]
VGGVITYKDATPYDVLCGIFNWKGKILEDRVRYVGDEVAAVAAISECLAETALDAMTVDYEKLPTVFDIEEAAGPGAPDVKGVGSNITSSPPEPGIFPSNQGWGDVSKGFAESEARIESEFRTQSIYGSFFPPACIAEWDGDRVTIMQSHQCPFELRIAIANALGIPEANVRLIVPMIAGTFGMLNSGHRIWAMAALLARKAGKPVVYKMTLEEYGVYKRRENDILRVKIGGKRDGTITALDYEQLQDNGGYGYKSTAYGTMHDILPRANVKFHNVGINTNRFTSGCIRGVGDVPQAFALNQAVDMLCEKLGLDPIIVWKKNHTRTGDPRRTMGFPGKTLSSEGYDEMMDKGAKAIGWSARWKGWGKPYQVSGSTKRGVGMALGLHVSGVPFLPVASTFTVNHDGTAQVSVGFTDLGTGSKTTLAQIAAEVLGIKFENVFVIKDIDTDTVPYAPMTGASMTLHVGGSAVKVAALDAKRQILDIAATAPWRPDSLKDAANPEDLDIKDGFIFVKKDPGKKAPLKAVLAPPFAPMVIGRATRQDLPFPGPVAYVTMVSFADVEVDTEMGKVKVLKLIVCQDSGRIINPAICENQAYGGAAQSYGYALMEEVAFDPGTGKSLNPVLSDYWWPTSLDMPPMDVIFAETIDPVGPLGAKAIGETPAICPHAAIASAVYNAIGVRLTQLPITPDAVLKALGRTK